MGSLSEITVSLYNRVAEHDDYLIHFKSLCSSAVFMQSGSAF